MSGIFAIKGGGVGPLMANAILNFHFDYLTPSLIYFAANLGGHWICEVLQKKPSTFAIGMHLNKYWITHSLIDQQSNDDDGDYVCGGGDNIRHAWNGFGGDGIAEACKLRNNKSSCVTLNIILPIVIVFIIPIPNSQWRASRHGFGAYSIPHLYSKYKWPGSVLYSHQFCWWLKNIA